MKYIRIAVVLVIIVILIYIVIGFIAMDKGVGHYQYSNSLPEAKKEKTFISKYNIYDKNFKIIDSNAWSEYGREYDILDRKTILKNHIVLYIDDSKIQNHICTDHIESFTRTKELLTAFGRDMQIYLDNNNTDTIFIRCKMDTLYIIKK